VSRARTLGVLAGLVAVAACPATPAFAEFNSTGKTLQTQGNINVINAGIFTDGSATVVCNAKEIKAQYLIQGKAQIKQQASLTTSGAQLGVQVKEWGKCTATVASTKVAAEIKPCSLRVSGAGVGVETSCLIKMGSAKEILCELQIPAGMETEGNSGRGINVGLEQAKLENQGGNMLATVNLTGGGKGELAGESILADRGGSALCPLKTNEELTLEGFRFEAEQLNGGLLFFRAARYPAAITGVNEAGTSGIFRLSGGVVRCNKVKFTATLGRVTPWLAVTPEYKGPLGGAEELCETGTEEVKVNANGCQWELESNGFTDIAPRPCGPLEIKAKENNVEKCFIRIANQPFLWRTTYQNAAGGKLKVKMLITSIKYDGGVGCNEEGERNNGVYESETILEATNGGTADAIEVR
jgi:hypothetical protein